MNKAGRKLDKMIYEKIMGCDYVEGAWEYKGWLSLSEPPNYSTSIDAAWEVVEKLEEDSWRWTIHTEREMVGVMIERGDDNNPRPGEYECHEIGYLALDRDEFMRSTELTVPLAICRAALRTLEVVDG